MKEFDFILFEHSLAFNHQKDLEIIAKLMMTQGLKVAIAEVYNEHEYCKDSAIPHYIFKTPFQYRFVERKQQKKWLYRIVKNFFLTRKYHSFLKNAIAEISSVSSNIYVGSLFNYDNYSWLKETDPTVSIYLWGLRSFWLYEYKIRPFSIEGFYSFINRNILYRNTNLKLFVSNDIIKQEFISLGIHKNRIVIRPERVTERIVLPHNRNDGFLKLLTIGSIRSDKRVEKTIEAMNRITDNHILFTIAGVSANPNYNKIIVDSIGNNKNITRVNKRLTELEFQSYMEGCDFLVLSDKPLPSCVTNGTMDEALLSGKPIIAPNYNPYKYFVEKYNVGILFDPDSLDSLVSALSLAKERGVDFFLEGLKKYQEELLVEQVSINFVKQLL